MAQPRSPNSDPRRSFSFSGLTVILGLVLLVLTGTALAVATYLALGPMSFRRQAITRAIEEDAQASRQSAAEARESAPATTSDATPAQSQAQPEASPRVSDQPPQADGGHRAAKPQAVEQPPEPPTDPAATSLTDLTPIEVLGAGVHAGDWRGPVTCGEHSFRQAIALRPTEDQGLTQIAFALQARFTQLRGWAAVIGEPSSTPAGLTPEHPQAVFRIYGDGNLLWESDRLVGPGRCQALQCELDGVDVLTLTAESDSPASLSNLAWGDPILMAAEPAGRTSAPQTPPAP